jgi:GAF domain-containing protein/multidrug resistance efflux pump
MEMSSALAEFSSFLLACRDQDTLRKTFVTRLGNALDARGVFLWLPSQSTGNGAEGGLLCVARWVDLAGRMSPVSGAVSGGILAQVMEDSKPLRLGGADLDRDSFTHFPESQRASIQSALLVPFPGISGTAGVVEILNKKTGQFNADDLRFAETAARLASQGDTLWVGVDAERQIQLETIERLTALYDISRIFNSTLELKELMPIVAGKIRDILHAEACNLWLVGTSREELELSQKDGNDPTVEDEAKASMETGHLAEVAKTATPRLIEDPSSEESLTERLKNAGDFEIESIICSPMMKDTQVIGIVELINKTDGTPFTEDDLFFLSSISEQAAVALHNANLLESERKLHEIHALLKISQEITSTLDLDHVLTTVVHQASTAVPFDKSVIGFFDRGRFVLGAVSGETEVPKSNEMAELRTLLEWVSTQDSAVTADQYSEGWTTSPEDAPEILTHYLEGQSYHGFYAQPLKDDQGTLGVLALMSGDSEFLTPGQRETVIILANQTTVAIRNAQLYQQQPLAGILQPLAEKKKRLLEIVPEERWLDYAGKVLLVLAALIFIPWPVRVSTNAIVVPAERRTIAAMAGGIVRHVFVHEGDPVHRDQIIAQLDDSEDQVKLERARTDLALSEHSLAEAEFGRDLSTASQARLHASSAQALVQLEQDRVAYAQLRSPIDGVVITPKIEDKTGVMLQPGETFCEVVEDQRMAVDMNVPETDLILIRPGKHISLKLNAFPTTTFRGTVDRVGARSIAVEGDEYFIVRATFDNSKARARDGMAGRAHIRAGGGWFGTGWYPIGYAIFRTPARWFWEKLWTWLP